MSRVDPKSSEMLISVSPLQNSSQQWHFAFSEVRFLSDPASPFPPEPLSENIAPISHTEPFPSARARQAETLVTFLPSDRARSLEALSPSKSHSDRQTFRKHSRVECEWQTLQTKLRASPERRVGNRDGERDCAVRGSLI
jgi:hypothetical protein